MEIKVLKQKDNLLVLNIKNTDEVFVNTLRRAIITEVPTFAVKNVKFTKNSSALFDEMISHRLGLLSLTTDLKTYNLLEECSCKGAGCAKCQSIITLSAEGPLTVYASDLKFKDQNIKTLKQISILIPKNRKQWLVVPQLFYLAAADGVPIVY